MNIQRRHKTDVRPMILKVSALWPQAVQKWMKKNKLSIRAWITAVSAAARSSPRHVHFGAPVTSSPRSPGTATKWNPAGHVVQVLLAAHHTVIEMFISPLVVREAMSINGAQSHHWNFGATTAALGSFPCGGQVRFAKVKAGWKLN